MVSVILIRASAENSRHGQAADRVVAVQRPGQLVAEAAHRAAAAGVVAQVGGDVCHVLAQDLAEGGPAGEHQPVLGEERQVEVAGEAVLQEMDVRIQDVLVGADQAA